MMDGSVPLNEKLIDQCADIEMGKEPDHESSHTTSDSSTSASSLRFIAEVFHGSQIPDTGRYAEPVVENVYHRADPVQQDQPRQPIFTSADMEHPEKFCMKLCFMTCCFPFVCSWMAFEKVVALFTAIHAFMSRACSCLETALEKIVKVVAIACEYITWPLRMVWTSCMSPCLQTTLNFMKRVLSKLLELLWHAVVQVALVVWQFFKPVVDMVVNCMVALWMLLEAALAATSSAIGRCCDACGRYVSCIMYWPMQFCKVVQDCVAWSFDLTKHCVTACCCQPLAWLARGVWRHVLTPTWHYILVPSWSYILKPACQTIMDLAKAVALTFAAVWASILGPMVSVLQATGQSAADALQAMASSVKAMFR
mmetsp:Transcript_18491/g.43258  ORF Transcript_18491/g.43258 Transcript_18491/m.43258 type:complete len:367 (-) Transcript_18491:78-1178(-)